MDKVVDREINISPALDGNTQICKGCKIEKPLSDFEYFVNRQKYNSWCNDCVAKNPIKKGSTEKIQKRDPELQEVGDLGAVVELMREVTALRSRIIRVEEELKVERAIREQFVKVFDNKLRINNEQLNKLDISLKNTWSNRNRSVGQTERRVNLVKDELKENKALKLTGRQIRTLITVWEGRAFSKRSMTNLFLHLSTDPELEVTEPTNKQRFVMLKQTVL